MSFTVNDIAQALGANVEGAGSLVLRRPSEPGTAGPDDLALAMNEKFAEDLSKGAARAAILWDGADWRSLGLEAAIFVPRPRYAMAHVTRAFDSGRVLSGIHPSAVIDASAEIGANVAVGPFAVIGAGVRIGDGSRIFSHVSIAENAHLGASVTLFEGVRIGHSVELGPRVTVHPNTVIGADGFSYVTAEEGAIDAFKSGETEFEDSKAQPFARIHSLGAVRIGADVEIGAGATFDRGTIRDTVIGAGTKIDNLVHVAHNVTVGEGCLLCGQVGIAGSSTIGDRVVLGGQVGVADHVTIGSDVIVAGKAGISSNVPGGRAMMGNPAIPMDINIAAYKVYRRLPRLAEKVDALQKHVSKFLPKD